MELATQTLTDKPRDAYYWRLFATAASFALFGFGGLCLRLLVFPLLSCLPGGVVRHRHRARHTISWLFWQFVRVMRFSGVLTYQIDGAEPSIACGAFDDPTALPPTEQDGCEAELPFVAGLSQLPRATTAESVVEQPLFADIVSHQHPDHDTAVWPFEED